MPRTPDRRIDNNTFIQRTAEVRAVGAVCPETISISPDEDRFFADNTGNDPALGHCSKFGPLGQIEAIAF